MKIAITGVTGSLGQELARQLLGNNEIESIRGISRSESRQAEMERNLNTSKIGLLIGDVRDYDRMKWALRGIDRVYHCAALKRVEKGCDVNEFILTNVIGTKNVCLAAESNKCEKVIFVSSDKAAYPSNTYGKTKALAEDYVLSLNKRYTNYRTRFGVVRYGNVLGSTGSILQLWPEQAKTGTIKVTDKRMTRFWITLERAAGFVIRCMDGLFGGEVFLPKMKSFGVESLARLLYPECKIEYIGMRDNGEKLHERLIIPEEASRIKDYGDKYIIGGNHFGGAEVEPDFEYRSDLVARFTEEEMRMMI